MIFVVVTCAFLGAAALPRSLAFVNESGGSRPRSTIEAIASPLDQIKLDFVGSLENAYDLNPTNAASTSFLSRLVEQVTPESITRDMLESFEELGTGKWRLVYIQEYSTSFGFGSLFGDITAADVELYDGSITSNIQCNNPSPYEVRFDAKFGTARNNMLIKVKNVETKQMQHSEDVDGGLFDELMGMPTSIAQSIIEKNWSKLFSGVVVVDIAFIDDNLAVFDLDFLARVKGRRMCARKEPDFF